MTSKHHNINCPVGKHYEEKCELSLLLGPHFWGRGGGGGVKGVDACFTYIVKYRHLCTETLNIYMGESILM